jgi:hypothetical protein
LESQAIKNFAKGAVLRTENLQEYTAKH